MSSSSLAAWPFPWIEADWERVCERETLGQLAHALLITGPTGIGKQRFANELGQWLLCESDPRGASACGNCRGCRWVDTGVHPDLVHLAPEEDSKTIKIDQVRALSSELTLTAQAGGRRVAIVSPADNMTLAAANSLLKTLEEPPAATVILLVSERPAALPATIRSRCQQIKLLPAALDIALPWLRQQTDVDDPELLCRLTGNAPCAAAALGSDPLFQQRLTLLEGIRDIAAGRADPLKQADLWLKHDLSQGLSWLAGCVTDMIRLKTYATPPTLSNKDCLSTLLELSAMADIKTLFHRLDGVYEGIRHVDTPINQTLLMQDLLIEWGPDAR